jgi:hypothetical protein
VVPKSWDAKALASLEGPLPDKSHGFGLSLSSADRTALIAFLKTL